MIDEHAFNLRLLEVFRTEAQGHRREITSALRELERGGDSLRQADAHERLFRAAHTLNGAARAVNKSQIAALCQSLESIFALLKNRAKKGDSIFGDPWIRYYSSKGCHPDSA